LISSIACSWVAVALSVETPPVFQFEIPRASSEFPREEYPPGGGVQSSEFERLIPNTFWPAPPDTQAIVSAMQSAGAVRRASWQAVESANTEFMRTLESLAARFDEFEKSYPAQFFVNYPPIKPPEARHEQRALGMALVDAAERYIQSLEQADQTRSDATLNAAIDRFQGYIHQQLMRERPVVSRQVMMPDLSAILQRPTFSLSAEGEQILRAWDDESVHFLKRWHENRQNGYDQWQAGLSRSGVPEPPYRTEDWLADDRDAAIRLYRKCMAASHRDAQVLIRRSIAVMESLFDHLPPADARRLRLSAFAFFGCETPNLVERELQKRRFSGDSLHEAIAAWDRADWKLLRDAVLLATRDTEPFWPYHHRIEPLRPELTNQFQVLLQRRQTEAAKLMSQIAQHNQENVEPNGQPNVAAASAIARRRESFTTLVASPPHPGLGGFDQAIRSAPESLSQEWIDAVVTALGPVSSMLDVSSIVKGIDAARAAGKERVANVRDAWQFSCGDGYRFDPVANAQLRFMREEIRQMIANSERNMLDELEKFTAAASNSDRLRLYVLARRANEHRMVEVGRAHLAPHDPAAMIEPLTALASLELPVDVERHVWHTIERDAEEFVVMRRAWLETVISPILDYYDERNAAVWCRTDETAARINRTRRVVQAAHERHTPALGDAAISLVSQIECALDDLDRRRFRRAIMIQVCPSVWTMEPSALTEIRNLSARAVSTDESTIWASALHEAEADDLTFAVDMTKLLGAYDAAAPWKSPTDLTIRLLITRRVEQAEGHLARALSQTGDSVLH
jgi:hypothetical protein